VRPRSRNKILFRQTGYELYYERLGNIASTRVRDNRIVLDLRSFGGIATIEITIHGFSQSADSNTFDPVCVIDPTWRVGRPLTLDFSMPRAAFDLRIKDCSATQLAPRLRQHNYSVALEANCREHINDQQEITFVLEATNLCIPLPERAPLNRSVVGIAVQWPTESDVETRIELIRRSGSTTCFTKGNYVLAFPSRPFEADVKTLILFPRTNSIRLLYGFIKDPSTVLLRAASMLVISGLGFVAAWLMAEAVIPGTPGNLIPYIALLVTLTLPTLNAFSELATSDRHALYSRRRDIGFGLMSIAIIAGVCGMLAAIYLFISSGFGARQAPTVAGQLPSALLIVAGFLLTLGIAVLGAYRSGFVIPYLCDHETCDRRLRWRYRRPDCYTTGRIMCKRCEKLLCRGCAGNYWERGPSSLSTEPLSICYRCLQTKGVT
jgi:hypothetical protein